MRELMLSRSMVLSFFTQKMGENRAKITEVNLK